MKHAGLLVPITPNGMFQGFMDGGTGGKSNVCFLKSFNCCVDSDQQANLAYCKGVLVLDLSEYP